METLNKYIKFYDKIEIPSHFWEIVKNLQGAIFSAKLCSVVVFMFYFLHQYVEAGDETVSVNCFHCAQAQTVTGCVIDYCVLLYPSATACEFDWFEVRGSSLINSDDAVTTTVVDVDWYAKKCAAGLSRLMSTVYVYMYMKPYM